MVLGLETGRVNSPLTFPSLTLFQRRDTRTFDGVLVLVQPDLLGHVHASDAVAVDAVVEGRMLQRRIGLQLLHHASRIFSRLSLPCRTSGERRSESRGELSSGSEPLETSASAAPELMVTYGQQQNQVKVGLCSSSSGQQAPVRGAGCEFGLKRPVDGLTWRVSGARLVSTLERLDHHAALHCREQTHICEHAWPRAATWAAPSPYPGLSAPALRALKI